VTGQGTRELLTPSTRNLAEEFINRWIEPSYNPEFWQTDTSVIFSSIIEDARAVLVSAGAATDDDTLFYMFQLIVLNYAYCAIDQPSMREFMKKPPHPELTQKVVKPFWRKLFRR
jgi:hypothetical protein